MNYSLGTRVRIVPAATAFVVVVCLSIVAVDAWRTYNAMSIHLHEGEVAANNLSRSIAQHAIGTLKEVDAVVMGLVDRLESDGPEATRGERIHLLMARLASSMSQLQTLSIIAPDGHWIATSLRTNITNVDDSDRDYFKQHQASASRDTFVGPLVRSKATNEWTLTLSRRFNLADGT